MWWKRAYVYNRWLNNRFSLWNCAICKLYDSVRFCKSIDCNKVSCTETWSIHLWQNIQRSSASIIPDDQYVKPIFYTFMSLSLHPSISFFLVPAPSHSLMHSKVWLLHRRQPPLLRSNSKIRLIPKCTRSNRPTQASKHGSRLRNVTHLTEANPAIQEHSQRHEPSKPEKHGERVKCDKAPAEAGR